MPGHFLFIPKSGSGPRCAGTCAYAPYTCAAFDDVPRGCACKVACRDIGTYAYKLHASEHVGVGGNRHATEQQDG